MKSLIYVLILIPLTAFAASVYVVISREPEAPSPPMVGNPPDSSDPQVIRGWEVFSQKGCVFCHGADALGGVKNPNAVGGEIPALEKVADGYTEEELKHKIRKGVKDIEISAVPGASSPPLLYMPSWDRSVLSDEELEDLITYLMSLAPETDSWE